MVSRTVSLTDYFHELAEREVLRRAPLGLKEAAMSIRPPAQRSTEDKPDKPGHWDIETQVFARARPRFDVRFGRSGGEGLRAQVETEISQALQWVSLYREDRANVEVGGYLATWGDDPLELRWAIGSDPAKRREDGAKRTTNSVSLDREYAVAMAAAEGARIVGDWHSHPYSDEGIPSPHDAKNWGRHAAAEGRGGWVSLIACPSEGIGWSYPHFHAWVTTDKNDVRNCWPATIVGDE